VKNGRKGTMTWETIDAIIELTVTRQTQEETMNIPIYLGSLAPEALALLALPLRLEDH
jgi:hypothetical protein